VPDANPDKSSVTDASDHKYVYGKVPPLTNKSIVPSLPGTQLGFIPNNEIVGGNEFVKVLVPVAVHPFESVTVTSYVPDANPDKSSVTDASDHKYVYGKVPPVTTKSIVPSLPGTQLRFVTNMVIDGGIEFVKVVEPITVHPLLSVTVTLYVPDNKDVTSSFVLIVIPGVNIFSQLYV